MRSRRIAELLNDVPLVLIEDGRQHGNWMKKARVGAEDILEAGRQVRAVERLEQTRYAVPERRGGISVIPYPAAGDRPPAG